LRHGDYPLVSLPGTWSEGDAGGIAAGYSVHGSSNRWRVIDGRANLPAGVLGCLFARCHNQRPT
jgi:hypothetical protein